MMQPGPYSNDNYSMGGGPYGEPAAPASPLSSVIDLVKSNIKTIVLLAAVAIVGFYAYDYFIGSQVNTTIQVQDIDGKMVPNVTGYLLDASGNRVEKSSLSSDEKRITLRRGEYEIVVQADGYDVVNGTGIKVETTADAAKDFTVTMARHTRVSFKESNAFPDKIVEGQELVIPLAFENVSGKTESIELTATASTKISGLTLEVAPTSLAVPNGGSQATLLITAANPMGVDSKGQTITVTLQVKGTLEKQTFSLNVRKSPSFRVTPTSSSFTTTAGKALQSQTITITNGDKTDYAFEPAFEVEVTESNNAAEEVKSWFSVINISPTSGTLRSTSPDNKSVITFEVRPSASAITDQISGVIKISTDYWSTAVPFKMNVTAAKNIIGITMSPATFTVRREGTKFENKNAILSLTNGTAFDIENISISLDDPTGCGSYIKFDEATIALLPKDATSGQNKKDIQVTITAPASAKIDTVKACSVLVTYDDPTNPGSRIDPAIQKLVQITPIES